MKPIFQRNIVKLSGKSREERGSVIRPLYRTDSKLNFYRKFCIGYFIFVGPIVTAFFHKFALTTIFVSSFLVTIVLFTFIQLFLVNPRLKKLLDGENKI